MVTVGCCRLWIIVVVTYLHVKNKGCISFRFSQMILALSISTILNHWVQLDITVILWEEK